MEIKDFDNIKKAKHYNMQKIETIDYLEGTSYYEGFCLGNAIKYISRCNFKNSKVADLQKAIYYINKIIEKENK